MKDERITTTYRGHELIFYEQDGIWGPAAHDTPIPHGSMNDVKKAIDTWEREKVDQTGVEVWSIEDNRAKYWSKMLAVYFTPASEDRRWSSTHVVHTRNGDGIFPRHCGDLAPNTPEAREAIELAKAAYEEAIAATKRYEDAKRAIPRVNAEMFRALPDAPSKR